MYGCLTTCNNTTFSAGADWLSSRYSTLRKGIALAAVSLAVLLFSSLHPRLKPADGECSRNWPHHGIRVERNRQLGTKAVHAYMGGFSQGIPFRHSRCPPLGRPCFH